MLATLRRRLTAIPLAALLLLPAASARADQPTGASAHVLVLDPLDVEAPAASFGEDLPCINALVGYQHLVDTSVFGDSYWNCVHQMTLYFNVWDPLQQYPGAVITQARLSYDDEVREVATGDGSQVSDPHDVQQDAVWGSCVGGIGIPNDDWSPGLPGLVPYWVDDTVVRQDRTTWDVSSPARRWYVNYANLQAQMHLVLVGYDEGTEFSNNAACVSALNSFKLTLEFVSNDPTPTPTPTPTPNLAQQALAGGRAGSGALPTDTPTPVPFHRTDGPAYLPTATPSSNVAISRAVPDLVIAAVDVASSQPAPRCGLMSFTAHVKNTGAAASEDSVVVSLSVDGVPRATTTVGPLAAGAETTATLSGGGLGSGTHVFSVTVNEGRKIVESDFSNNSFGRDNLVCL